MAEPFKEERLSWEEYFIEIVKATAKRASCDRGKSGAVIVKHNTVLSTGYVGAPRGLPDCDRVGHDIVHVTTTRDLNRSTEQGDHCIRTVHAEMNAILNAARHGLSCLDAEMYCTMVPCRNCAMAIIQSGIKKVIAMHPYHKSKDTWDMFHKAGVEMKVMSDKELY